MGDRGQLAGPPEGDEVFELHHDAQEAGADQGAQGGLHASRSGGVGAQLRRDASDRLGQGG